MINIVDELAVQSFCYRGFKDTRDFIAKVKETGLDKVEVCAVHIDFADDAKFDEIIDIYQSEGVDIVSIGVNRFANDEAAERKYFEFVRKCGASFLSADFAPNAVPDAYRTAEKLADEYDVKLGIHNHGGRHWLGSTQMLNQVFSSTSERIGLCLDTAWALDAGEDPVAMAEKFGDRLYGVHFKDFTFDTARKHKDVVVGTGNLDLAGLNDVLKKIDFNGYAVLEYEGDVDNPVPALSECVEVIQKTMI